MEKNMQACMDVVLFCLFHFVMDYYKMNTTNLEVRLYLIAYKLVIAKTF